MAGVVVLFLLAVLTACGGDEVDVDGFRVSAADRGACARVIDALPSTVGDERRREVSGSRYAAAWGDPAFVLRCGVPLPKDFATDPCITRNGIGWSVPAGQADGKGDVVMTLAFRTPVLQVRVPEEYRPNGPGDVMADLAATVRAHTTAHGRCS